MDRLTLTVSEAAAVLGVSRSTAYECVRTGELRAVRLGRRLVVPRSAIVDLLNGPSSPTFSGAASSVSGATGGSVSDCPVAS